MQRLALQRNLSAAFEQREKQRKARPIAPTDRLLFYPGKGKMPLWGPPAGSSRR